jgi:V/A-type H+/Na+-transporting ATPase subunit D
MAERVPPGRAGRLWLLNRLAFARRSLELLDRKHQLLLEELAGLGKVRDEARARWDRACREAERWGVRVAALGGESDLALAAASVAGRAEVDVPWRNTMGVVHPGLPHCELPDLAPTEAAAGNGAVAPAAAAHREALDCAAAYAAVDRSHRLLDREVRETARRRRAIEHHRIPSLDSALQHLELRLDEVEREERVVGRWVRRRYGSVADRLAGGGGSRPRS